MSCLALLSAILLSFLLFLGPVLGPVETAVAPNPLSVQEVLIPTLTAPEADPTFELGELVTGRNIDRFGCAAELTETFEPDEIVYVVAEKSRAAAGTRIFVRYYYENEIYDEAPEIVADVDYDQICIFFVLEPDSLSELREGDYEAEFIVNGIPVSSIEFTVED